jgi:hypothetical protein
MRTIKEIIQEIFSSYKFEEQIEDKNLLNEINNAVEEAYFLGTVHG